MGIRPYNIKLGMQLVKRSDVFRLVSLEPHAVVKPPRPVIMVFHSVEKIAGKNSPWWIRVRAVRRAFAVGITWAGKLYIISTRTETTIARNEVEMDKPLRSIWLPSVGQTKQFLTVYVLRSVRSKTGALRVALVKNLVSSANQRTNKHSQVNGNDLSRTAILLTPHTAHLAAAGTISKNNG